MQTMYAAKMNTDSSAVCSLVAYIPLVCHVGILPKLIGEGQNDWTTVS